MSILIAEIGRRDRLLFFFYVVMKIAFLDGVATSN